ncbi:uncharacterized protein MONOS_9205 [Monocercomonoides exilis]|uniref:uncharacterized protein n=1 Tax=Monocercomonoides exilis TaxID=2049356 RepID=UPI0035596699|nr:hypothetical protein MONOS_9205 [Monocercomonoides exilis]|eukprot:MONOS_9205.1-p1 / transcript=MONOS_9205.1 / gene=MONOS_9205 / organism=Monocercomonoides_exilis_PA203 / gene_product=unspecified product / transcript_product=unspecified product / location=Mono_scaffold00371:36048-39426(+) / protein_length=919 / sequence_SO=supercontig / SO=protein_coding / is_pseudo=false
MSDTTKTSSGELGRPTRSREAQALRIGPAVHRTTIDESLIRDAEDRRKLMQMTERERELELAKRIEIRDSQREFEVLEQVSKRSAESTTGGRTFATVAGALMDSEMERHRAAERKKREQEERARARERQSASEIAPKPDLNETTTGGLISSLSAVSDALSTGKALKIKVSDFQQCIVTRDMVDEVVYLCLDSQMLVSQMLVGLYCRIASADKTTGRHYVIGEIHSVRTIAGASPEEAPKPYVISRHRSLLTARVAMADGQNKDCTFNYFSNTPVTEGELHEWIKGIESVGRELPTAVELRSQRQRLNEKIAQQREERKAAKMNGFGYNGQGAAGSGERPGDRNREIKDTSIIRMKKKMELQDKLRIAQDAEDVLVQMEVQRELDSLEEAEEAFISEKRAKAKASNVSLATKSIEMATQINLNTRRQLLEQNKRMHSSSQSSSSSGGRRSSSPSSSVQSGSSGEKDWKAKSEARRMEHKKPNPFQRIRTLPVQMFDPGRMRNSDEMMRKKKEEEAAEKRAKEEKQRKEEEERARKEAEENEEEEEEAERRENEFEAQKMEEDVLAEGKMEADTKDDQERANNGDESGMGEGIEDESAEAIKQNIEDLFGGDEDEYEEEANGKNAINSGSDGMGEGNVKMDEAQLNAALDAKLHEIDDLFGGSEEKPVKRSSSQPLESEDVKPHSTDEVRRYLVDDKEDLLSQISQSTNARSSVSPSPTSPSLESSASAPLLSSLGLLSTMTSSSSNLSVSSNSSSTMSLPALSAPLSPSAVSFSSSDLEKEHDFAVDLNISFDAGKEGDALDDITLSATELLNSTKHRPSLFGSSKHSSLHALTGSAAGGSASGSSSLLMNNSGLEADVPLIGSHMHPIAHKYALPGHSSLDDKHAQKKAHKAHHQHTHTHTHPHTHAENSEANTQPSVV